MNEANYKNVKYSRGYEFTGEIKELRFGYQKVMTDCVKRYNNCQYLLAHLDKCSEMFLMYLTEQMDPMNTIHITGLVRKRFIKHMKNNCGLRYEDSTVKSALTSLKKSDLLINHGLRIDYTVNPYYFFKGTEKERIQLIKSLLYDCSVNEYPKSNIHRALLNKK